MLVTCFTSKTDIQTFKLKPNSNVGLHEVNEAERSNFLVTVWERWHTPRICSLQRDWSPVCPLEKKEKKYRSQEIDCRDWLARGYIPAHHCEKQSHTLTGD